MTRFWLGKPRPAAGRGRGTDLITEWHRTADVSLHMSTASSRAHARVVDDAGPAATTLSAVSWSCCKLASPSLPGGQLVFNRQVHEHVEDGPLQLGGVFAGAERFCSAPAGAHGVSRP